MILVATPARLSTPKELLQRVERVVHNLGYSGTMEWRLHLNEQPPARGQYEPNARARNELIDRYLKPWHEWVLWVDADIIGMPTNLINTLMEASLRWGTPEKPAIVAPLVWMERVNEGPVGIQNGGWFYDTGGFVGRDGVHADFHRGPLEEGDEIEMMSVGCVYLAPASLYRSGLRYRPQGNEVEHLSWMRGAREAGHTVVATRRAEVVHAYLPKYGEEWHHRARKETA